MLRAACFACFCALLACGGDDDAVDAATDTIATDTIASDTIVTDTIATDVGDDVQRDAFDPRCGECSAVAPWRCDTCLPSRLQEITAVTLGERIWVAGGFDFRAGVVPNMRIFDPATGTWSEGPPMPDPRHHLMLATFDGDLWAFGGMRDGGFVALNTTFVLRAGSSDWETSTPMPSARAAGFAGRIGGRIYVAAGQGDGRNSTEKLEDAADVFIFDPSDETWTRGASIPTLREHCAGFVANDELWILGGRLVSLEPTFDTVEIYDPIADEWRAGPDMPSAHGGFAAAVLDDVAYVSGGEQRDEALATFEALNLATEEWSRLEPIPTPRHGHAMAAAAGRVYVIGGADRPVFASVDDVESYAP